MISETYLGAYILTITSSTFTHTSASKISRTLKVHATPVARSWLIASSLKSWNDWNMELMRMQRLCTIQLTPYTKSSIVKLAKSRHFSYKASTVQNHLL